MRKIGLYMLLVLLALTAAGIYLDMKDNPEMGITKLINNTMNDVDLKNYGNAPEFAGISKWLNSEPLTMQQLQGKVVLIDFWTYSCINCIRTLPYVTSWYEKYKDKGFVIVGVHTPEFAFEKDTSNVQTALKRHGINYPVAQDNDYGTWRAYSNRYWPAHYLVDQTGKIVYAHFGEGKYEETEQAIQQLLGIGDESEMADTSVKRDIKTPEIYFGLNRLEHLASSQKAQKSPTEYSYPSELKLNEFALSGRWSFTGEHAKLESDSGKIRLKFYSKDVHMVAMSNTPAKVKVYIDGTQTSTIDINNSQLYTLFEGQDSQQRVLELEIDGSGFEAFTFTFG